MTTTPEQRAEWSRLAEAATAGPWETQIEDRSGAYVVGPSTNPHIPSPDVVATTRFSDRFAADDGANMSFIAASRTAIPPLLADFETLTEERDDARRRCQEFCDGCNAEAERRETAEAKAAALEAEVARLKERHAFELVEAAGTIDNERTRADIAERQLATVRAEIWEAAVKIADDQAATFDRHTVEDREINAQRALFSACRRNGAEECAAALRQAAQSK